MSYTLQAIIAARPVLRFAQEKGIPIVDLGQGFALIPLPPGNLDGAEMPLLPLLEEQAPLPPFVVDLCRRCSEAGRLIYVEAEFWGGQGTQAHARWENGVESGQAVVAPTAINEGLAFLGVDAGRAHDAF